MTATLRVGARTIGDGHPCYVIAEACVNHNGNVDTALRMIEVAAATGADAIKFQVHYPEHEMLREGVPESSNFGKPLWDILVETNLSDDQHRDLRDHCRRFGIEYLCTAYCREAGDFLASIDVAMFKIGSGETLNYPFLRSLARYGRPMLVSTGMATSDEIDRTIEVLRATGVPFGITHCTSEYPPVYEDLNLDLIPLYKERYGIVVGHSDHSPSIHSALAAITLGANVIEKHFSLDKTQEGPDHKVSIEPDELYELVKGARIIEASRGTRREVFERERPIRAWAHHSVVTLRPIAAGEALSEENVWVKRPGTGIPAAQLDEVLGKTAKRDLPGDALVAWDDLA